MDLDRESEARENAGLPSASANFSSTLFRQPALAEGRIRPAVYRKPGARNTLDVFGSSSRPSQLSQRRSVDGDFEVYDEIGVAREAGDDEDKGSSPFERQLHYQSVSSDEVEARSQRSSPRQSSLRSANTDSRKSLTEKLLTDTKSPCHDRSEANSQPDTDDLLNGGSDVCSNAELELEVDEILSAEEHEEQNETATLSSAILSHISPTKVLFK